MREAGPQTPPWLRPGPVPRGQCGSTEMRSLPRILSGHWVGGRAVCKRWGARPAPSTLRVPSAQRASAFQGQSRGTRPAAWQPSLPSAQGPPGGQQGALCSVSHVTSALSLRGEASWLHCAGRRASPLCAVEFCEPVFSGLCC